MRVNTNPLKGLLIQLAIWVSRFINPSPREERTEVKDGEKEDI